MSDVATAPVSGKNEQRSIRATERSPNTPIFLSCADHYQGCPCAASLRFSSVWHCWHFAAILILMKLNSIMWCNHQFGCCDQYNPAMNNYANQALPWYNKLFIESKTEMGVWSILQASVCPHHQILITLACVSRHTDEALLMTPNFKTSTQGWGH